jgi:hypothetical protein
MAPWTKIHYYKEILAILYSIAKVSLHQIIVKLFHSILAGKVGTETVCCNYPCKSNQLVRRNLQALVA